MSIFNKEVLQATRNNYQSGLQTNSSVAHQLSNTVGLNLPNKLVPSFTLTVFPWSDNSILFPSQRKIKGTICYPETKNQPDLSTTKYPHPPHNLYSDLKRNQSLGSTRTSHTTPYITSHKSKKPSPKSSLHAKTQDQSK